MGYDILLDLIGSIGYFALFLVLCLGLIGLPIPNEVVVMTAGMLGASGVLNPIPAFLSTALGICSAMSVGYVVGRYFAKTKVFKSLRRTEKTEQFFALSEKWIAKYGGFAISLSLCLPILRHVTMYVLGMNSMSYRKFAAFAYPSAFLWTLVYFLIGGSLEDHIPEIGALINQYGMLILILLIALVMIYVLYRYFRNKQNPESKEKSMKI
ncbi:DedA family protein [Neobacillus mesonae]|nr:DedA family protein [Neobacillus mesonae]